MFEKILIANRGEIACRIIKTAKRMGLRTVAVFSDADAAARHVALADEAFAIGPPPAQESYLKKEAIIEAAQESAAQAIHPGYGFLAESADFAASCQKAEIVFIGPPAQAIRAMGEKSAAKALMERAGIPVIPGYRGESQDPRTLRRQAEDLGFPILIKAVAGGGGKGMRKVERSDDFAAALLSAQREAKAAFGDERVLLEKYFPKARHIEIQVFADQKGHVLHLFERECSLQRRYQKVLEEAPAPNLSEPLRQAMAGAAVQAAQAIGYVNAGTVEFLLDGEGHFYFMEMNTRLQVEHPVTELITGKDLVEWQIRIAAGEPLPCAQSELNINGHAMEARLYAEDPSRDFLPSTGVLSRLRFPEDQEHVRVDTGLCEGSAVSLHYDPLIAKLIVWDADRSGALRRLRRALAETQIVGIASNIDFLATLIAHPKVLAGKIDTGFIERHGRELQLSRLKISDTVIALASLFILLQRKKEAERAACLSQDPYSPWHLTCGWRLNEEYCHDLFFSAGGEEIKVRVHFFEQRYGMELPETYLEIAGRLGSHGELIADLNSVRIRATVVRQHEQITVFFQGERHLLALREPLQKSSAQEAELGRLTAPMPARVVEVLVKPGEKVERGQVLMVLEAMKMEHAILASKEGVVTKVLFKHGDLVDEGVELLVLEDETA